jgi:hypothetical protein
MKRGRVGIFLLALLPSVVFSSSIYKWIDEEGNVVYSDTPIPGAQQVNVHTPQTYKPPPLPSVTPSKADEQQAEQEYTEFAIVKPENEETIRDNTGTVPVELSLTPTLDQTHQIVLKIDDEALLPGKSPRITLRNVNRGAHTLVAQVQDSEGNVLATSDPVTFYLQKASALLRPGGGRPEGGRPEGGHPEGR